MVVATSERPSIGRFQFIEPESIEEVREVLVASDVVLHSSKAPHVFRHPTPLTTARDIAVRTASWGNGLSVDMDRIEKLEARLTGWTPPRRTSVLDLSRHAGIVAHHVEDQVVVVRGGTRVRDLNDALARHGQTIPLGTHSRLRLLNELEASWSVAEAIDMNLPHLLSAPCGSWRDWILGVTVVLADGTVAKSGSQAVKNVAGYDVPRLFVGTRGTLGILVEVILRTYPVRALPLPDVIEGERDGLPSWIQRVLPSDFETAVIGMGDRLVLADRGSSTLWGDAPHDVVLPRYPEDWVLRSGTTEHNIGVEAATGQWMLRTKARFDPLHRLNPGEFGIF